MARWEPNARERLERAALELFLQRGYESTTVAEIAERAGLAKSTFFRHFTDKREVLFGRDELKLLLLDGIAGAPDTASPIEAIGCALQSAAAAFSPQRRAWVRQRQQAVAANSNLLERELLKRAGLAAAMAEALRARGTSEPMASLAAEVGSLALRTALARWVEAAPADGDGEPGDDRAAVGRAGRDARRDAGAGPAPGVGAGSGAGTDSSPATESGAGAGTGAGVGAGAGSGLATGPSAATGSGPGSASATGSGAGPGSGAPSGTGEGLQGQAGRGAEGRAGGAGATAAVAWADARDFADLARDQLAALQAAGAALG